MPSSPKLFHAQNRPSPASPRRSTVLILASCLLIGLAGFVFGLAALLSAPQKCANVEPRSIRVVWERVGHGVVSDGDGDGIGVDPNMKTRRRRQKVMGFVGIQIGFGSVGLFAPDLDAIRSPISSTVSISIFFHNNLFV